MITILRFFYYKFLHHGFDARKFLFSFISPSWFYRDFKKNKNQKGKDTTFKISNHYPIIKNTNCNPRNFIINIRLAKN